MATRAEIKEKLKKSLINKVLETEDSTVDNNIGTNFMEEKPNSIDSTRIRYPYNMIF